MANPTTLLTIAVVSKSSGCAPQSRLEAKVWDGPNAYVDFGIDVIRRLHSLTSEMVILSVIEIFRQLNLPVRCRDLFRPRLAQ
jgi:hypothetical protein